MALELWATRLLLGVLFLALLRFIRFIVLQRSGRMASPWRLWASWLGVIVVSELLVVGPWRGDQPAGTVPLWGPTIVGWTAFISGGALHQERGSKP